MTATKAKKNGQPEIWALERIKSNPLNPRGPVDPNDPKTQELVDSIKARGILQPLLLTPEGILIAGHRRRVAARLAGLTEVPVLVRAMSEAEQLASMLAENMQRDDLTPAAAARGAEQLRKRGMSADQIAAATGVSAAAVRKYLQLGRFPHRLLAAFDAPGVPLGYIDALVRIPDEQRRVEIGLRAIKAGWLVSELQAAVAETPNNGDRAPASQRAIKNLPGPTPAQPRVGAMAMVAILDQATAGLRRNESLIRDQIVWESIERLVRAAKELRGLK